MDFHEIVMKGKYWAQKLSTKPAWTSGDEARFIYAEDIEDVYVGQSTDWSLGLNTPRPGFIMRPKFEYSSTTDIKISSGYYECNGKLVWWDSELTFSFANLGSSDWSYLYLDESDFSKSRILTNADFIDAVIEPVYSQAKHGYYNGNDRCVFGVRTNGSSEILEFFHSGNYISYATAITDFSDDVDDDWADEVTLSIPKFATKANITINAVLNQANNAYWRTEGQIDTTGHLFASHTGSANIFGDHLILTSAAQKIDLKYTNAGTDSMSVRTNGWEMPTGM